MAFFGNTGTPAFGAPAAKPVTFGTTTFGAQPAAAAPSFGFGAFGQQQPQQQQQQAAPAFGSTFGQPASSAPPAFGSTFGAATSTAPAFGSTFGTAAPAATPAFGSTFGAAPQQGANVFGAPAAKPGIFGTPTTSQSLFPTPASGASNLFGTAGTTQTSNLFGGTATSGTSLFGTGTATTTSSLFGTGFGQAATTTAPSLFGTAPTGASGFGTGGGLFGAATSTAPSLFGTGTTGFGATTTSTASGFGGFGTGGGFGGFGTTTNTQPGGLFPGGLGAKPPGAPGQPAPQTEQSKNQQVIASVYALNVFNDERDDILKKWNMLQACWGVGKGFYNSSQPPVEYTPQNPFYRFKAMGYNIIPEHDNSEGIVRLVFNKKIDELRNQDAVLKNGIAGILGNRPNLSVEILLIKAISETQTEVKIAVLEKGVTGSSRKIPATDLASFLNQPTQKQQLSNVGIISIAAFVSPSKAELEEYLKQPPSGIDPQMWQAAIQDNPNPKKYIPVPINGFSDLRARMLNQEHQTGLHQAFLEKVGKDISELKTKHTSSIAHITELKQKLMELEHRILRVIVKQECTRKVGIAIQPEEELLRGRLEVMHTQLNLPQQFKGHLWELLAYIKINKRPQRQNVPNYRINGDALDDIRQYLKMEQDGITQLVNIVNKDTKSLKIVSDGLKSANHS